MAAVTQGPPGSTQQLEAPPQMSATVLSHTSSAADEKALGSASGLKWWTDEEEAAVRRKLDWHILPMLFIIYGAAIIDRSNTGNAKTAGMLADLGIDDHHYRLLLVIFYLAYIICQPLLLFYLVVPAHIWVASMAALWGISSALQGAAVNFSGLMAARWFVGLAEAGFGTGIALYLGFFYPRGEIGYRFAWFVTSSAVFSAIAGAIAYGLVRAHAALAGWRLLFIIEGSPSLILAVFIYFCLPDKPETCGFLDEREREIAVARLFRPKPSAASDTSNKQGHGISDIIGTIRHGMDRKRIKAGLLSPVAWLAALQLWVVNVGYGSVPIYLPTILKDSGFTAIKAQGYTAPAYLVAFVYTLVAVYISDRIQHRAAFQFAHFLVGAVGYIMLATLESNHGRYAAVFLVCLGLFPQVSFTYIYLITNVASERARGIGLTILGVVSQTGPLLGTLGLFPAKEGPYYRRGMWVSLGVTCAGIGILSTAVTYFVLHNRKRDLAQEKWEREVASAGLPTTSEAQIAEEEKTMAVNASARRRLAAKVTLNKEDPVEREEILRRYIDVSRRGEDSPYFRYVI
ncbi:unnamed protein product [Parajaminaea phylloscopi]